MKKTLSIIISCALALCLFCIFASASAEPIEFVPVYVSISDASGNLVLSYAAVDVTDTDADGAITISDALYAAHEKAYEGGAAAGYSSYTGEYGLSLGTLWGDNSGSFGYYLNDASAWSLADTIKAGDHIKAYIYQDTTAWSDTYCYFDTTSKELGEDNMSLTLTLSALGYDESYNTVVLPVENATITIDGKTTNLKTDAEGKVTVHIDTEGKHVISATSETQTLVPPVCVVTFGDADTEKGCGSSIGAAGTAMIALAGLATSMISFKRKEDK